MIVGLTYAVVYVAAAIGLVITVLGALGRKPSDLTVGLTLLVGLLLLVLGGTAIVMSIAGNGATGDVIEWIGYLVTALIVIAAAVFWSLIQRTRWGTVILGVAALTVAIMVVRMDQVWFAVPR